MHCNETHTEIWWPALRAENALQGMFQENVGEDTAQAGTIHQHQCFVINMQSSLSIGEASLTGCRPCGYILKCILCLSLQCTGPLAKRVKFAHSHTSLSRQGRGEWGRGEAGDEERGGGKSWKSCVEKWRGLIYNRKNKIEKKHTHILYTVYQ